MRPDYIFRKTVQGLFTPVDKQAYGTIGNGYHNLRTLITHTYVVYTHETRGSTQVWQKVQVKITTFLYFHAKSNNIPIQLMYLQ